MVILYFMSEVEIMGR